MALSSGQLIGELTNEFSSLSSSSSQGAIKLVSPFNTYISSIQNVGGGAFISFTGFSTLLSNVTDIFENKYSSGQVVGQLIATEFDNAIKTIQTVYQTAPPNTAGIGIFINDCIDIFSTLSPSSSQFAQNIGQAIHSFCTTTIITGIIPGTPPLPFSGPAS